MDLDTAVKISAIISPLIVPVVGYGAFVLRGLRSDMQALTMTLTDLAAWRAAHDKQDDERHRHVNQELARLRDTQNGIRHNLYGS